MRGPRIRVNIAVESTANARFLNNFFLPDGLPVMPNPSKLKQSRLTFESWEPLRQASSQRSVTSSPARSSVPRSSPPRLPRRTPTRTSPLHNPPPRSQARMSQRRSPQILGSSDEEEDSDDFNAIRLGPRSPSKATQRKGGLLSDDERLPHTTHRRVASSDESGSEKGSSSVEFVGSAPESSPPPARNTRSRARVTTIESEPEAQSEEDPPRRKLRRRRAQLSDGDSSPPRRKAGRHRAQSSDSESPPPRRLRRRKSSESPPPRRLRRPKSSESPHKRRRSDLRPDPDDEASASAATEDEDARAEIEMEEPERFAASSRLRETKESAWAADLRRLKESKESRGAPAAEYVDSASEQEEDWAFEAEEELDDFIASDDGEMQEELPEEFSHKRESTEYKFKVVFQYLLLLAIKGPEILPLSKSNTEYFSRQLRDVRNLMRGFRDSVASTLWKPEFREALEKYPVWKQADLFEREEFCDGCNRRNQHCYQTAWLRGQPYDRETHKILEAPSDNDGGDNDSEEESDERVLGNMGTKCIKRAHDFHELHHWEHQMYSFIKSQYNDLVRAKGREVRESSLASDSDMSAGEQRELAVRRRASQSRVRSLSSRSNLPQDIEDVDEVTEWMDRKGVQLKSMEWLGRVEGRARSLEGHYRT